MNPSLQTVLALLVVAVAAIWLVWRSVAKKKPGCGGGCGCEAHDLKSKLPR